MRRYGGPRLLRNDIRDLLRKRVVGGDYSPGLRLGVGDLSRELGVSPTPLREALSQLEAEGLVVADPNRGFFVPPFSVEEARDVYDALSALECLALRRGGVVPGWVERLERVNRRLLAPGRSPAERVKADRAWHAHLIEPCATEVLQNEIRRLRTRVERYEIAYMGSTSRIEDSSQDHEAITRLVSKGRHTGAARRLEQHWRRSTSFVIAALQGDPEPAPAGSPPPR